MSDFKSKLPDLKELGEITGKLFKDIKTSVSEIIGTYKQKHAEPVAQPAKTKKATAEEPKTDETAKEEPEKNKE